jgi:hypothetical protein
VGVESTECKGVEERKEASAGISDLRLQEESNGLMMLQRHCRLQASIPKSHKYRENSVMEESI